MRWHVTFYSAKVEADTRAFPKGILASFLHIAEMIEQFGPNLGKPYVGSLGQGLYEIRSKGAEGIGRSFYCTLKGQEVIVLHSFTKKSQKTPQRELELARKHMKEVQT